MKETVYIRKKSPIFQAYDVNLHVVYRNPKAITEYDYVLDLQTIEQHDEDVRKETAKEILILLGIGIDENTGKRFKDLSWYEAFCRELKFRYGVELEDKK